MLRLIHLSPIGATWELRNSQYETTNQERQNISCPEGLVDSTNASVPRSKDRGQEQSRSERMVSQEQLESRFLRRRHRLTTDCIVDACMIRIRPRKADSIEVRLVQLKAGASGLTAAE